MASSPRRARTRRYRLYGDPKSCGPEHRAEASQLRIARLGQHPVRRLTRQARLARNRRNAALRDRHLAEREHDRHLIAVVKDGFEVSGGLGGVL
jgi:hypothetical protein